MAILKPYNAVLSEGDVSVILETSTQVLTAHPLAAEDIIRAIRWAPFTKPFLDQVGAIGERLDALAAESRELTQRGKELGEQGEELEQQLEEIEERLGAPDERT